MSTLVAMAAGSAATLFGLAGASIINALRRNKRHELRIKNCLRYGGPMRGLHIARCTGVPQGGIYVTLSRMIEDGEITITRADQMGVQYYALVDIVG